MRYRLIFISTLIVYLAFGGTDIASKFLYKLKQMSMIKVDFEQKFYPVGYQNPIISYGEAYIENKPPFKIKLIYKKPNPFIILYDGKKTILYNKSTKEAYSSNGKNEEIDGIGVLNKNLEEIFRPILTSYQDGYYQILFIPRTKVFKDIDYVILKLTKDMKPYSFYVYMPKKGVLYIKVLGFSNEKLDEGVFKLN